MKELVIISGKGGTGKTSITGAFASLAGNSVLADCDVDAADLHLLLKPRIIQKHDFCGGSRALIRNELCTDCGKCREVCRFDAIEISGPVSSHSQKTYQVDPVACEGCGICAYFCPAKAIQFDPAINGEWYISETDFGPMIHARLGMAEGNSGKLVSLIRCEAKKIAKEEKIENLLIDGSPGIGCPVIASITGADRVLIITEPTLSGLHDLRRVAELTRHFHIPAMVGINKWDINEEITGEITRQAKELGLTIAGKIRYSRAVTEAQVRQVPIVEYTNDGISQDIRELWQVVKGALTKSE